MSSQKTGYSFFKDKQLIDYGLWEMSSSDEADWRKRIQYMAKCISNYCDSHDIDIAYVEDVPPIAQNSQTVKILSALQGMIIAMFAIKGLEFHFVPVKNWKSKIGINLTASKENNVCKKQFKDFYGAKANRYIEKLKNKTKAYEKKLSVEYANKLFGLDLVYKSASSKKNQDDIADAICVVAANIYDEPYYNFDFESIMSNIYDSVVQ